MRNPQNDEFFPMTASGKKKLDEELDFLVKVERERLKVVIAEARAQGDLKENADYAAAKEKQAHVEGRILELQFRTARCKVINVASIKSEKIVFGATVTLLHDEEDKEVTYTIVGADESNSKLGRISYTSPVAKALLGKEEGDEVIVKAPKGDVAYTIQEIKFVEIS